MALPKEHEGFEDALNIVAEIVSTYTGITGTGSAAIWGIKSLLKHFPVYTLKRILNKKNVKALGIPDDKYIFVFDHTKEALSSINSVDYNPVVFRKEIFSKNNYFPTLIGAELVENLHLDDDSDLLNAVRFVIAVYLLHWSEEQDFPLEIRQELFLLKAEVKKNANDIINIRKTIEDLRNRINNLEEARKETIPNELTVIPKSIATLFGRETVVQNIITTLKTDHILCLTADGGLGKTAIAKNIVNNIRDDIEKDNCKYKHVAWLTSSGNLKKDLSNISISNFASDGNENRYKKACRFLKTYPTFLVIDNMDELPSPDEINILNTISGKSTILITSRAKIDVFPSYKLQPLDRDDAVVLFYNHYFHNPAITEFTHNIIQEEKNTGRIEDARKIVDATGGNALIIELIAKTAHADVLSVTELWEKVRSGIFGFESKTEVQTDHSGKYPESKLSIDEQMRSLYSMLKLTDKQKEIMSFISLFPAEHDIFSDVFKWAGFFDQGANDMMYLVERGWIIREGKYYSIHTVVRDSINMQNKKSGAGISILNYEELIEKLSDTDSYLPRTTEYSLAQKLSFVPQTIGQLLSGTTTYSPALDVFFNNLACLYNDQGNYDEALKFFKIDIDICEKALGKDHAETATLYNNLAGLYRSKYNYKEALKYYKKSLEISEKTLGKNHPDTASTYNNLAGLYMDQSNYDKALNYYKKALIIYEKKLGKDHADIAVIYNNIALLFQLQSNYDEAQKYYNKALEIDERMNGTDHPDTAKTYNNMATLYHDQGNYDEALKYYKMALKIRERKKGKDHPDTAVTYNNIASLYKDQGNYHEALKCYKLALEIRENKLGKDHPYTAITYNGLAGLYRDLSNYKEALKYYKMALRIREKTLGIHQDTAKTYEKLAILYLKMGNHEKSKDCKTKADEIRKKLKDS